MKLYSRLLIVLLLACGLSQPVQAANPANYTQAFCKKHLNGELWSRTELFFGLSKPGNAQITEDEFQTFINTEVTPRFPDGLTVLSGKGQYLDSQKMLIKEGSKLIILFYPFGAAANQLIEQIRSAYKTAFQQESVLRADEINCISF